MCILFRYEKIWWTRFIIYLINDNEFFYLGIKKQACKERLDCLINKEKYEEKKKNKTKKIKLIEVMILIFLIKNDF